MHQHSIRDGVEGKECSNCSQWYPLDDYGRQARPKDGLSSRCSKCRLITRRKYQAKYPKRSTQFYHEHLEQERAKRKVMRKAHTERDAIADPKFVKRFLAKVSIRGPDECWEWTAHRFPQGYGEIGYKGAIFGAHRIAFLLAGNEIPEGYLVCHQCDNRPCCNPKHLFLGTYLDNAQDKVSKKRQWRPIGEQHPLSKVTWEQVREIRQMYSQGFQQQEIAMKFHIGQQNVSDIVLNNSWYDAEYVPIRKRRGIR